MASRKVFFALALIALLAAASVTAAEPKKDDKKEEKKPVKKEEPAKPVEKKTEKPEPKKEEPKKEEPKKEEPKKEEKPKSTKKPAPPPSYPKPVVSGDAYDKLYKKDYVFSHPIGKENTRSANSAKALTVAGVAQTAVTLEPYYLFGAHYHPNSSEIFAVASGSFVAFVVVNKKVYSYTLKAGDTILFPKGHVHGYFNIGHENAVAYLAFASSTPGSIFVTEGSYAKYSPSLLYGKIVEKEILVLVAKATYTDKPTPDDTFVPLYKKKWHPRHDHDDHHDWEPKWKKEPKHDDEWKPKHDDEWKPKEEKKDW